VSAASDMYFLGYVVKRVEARPDWHKAAHVRAIASVSNCISSEPEVKFDHWTFNGWGRYDTLAAALECLDFISPPHRDKYTVFAHKLLTRRFVAGAAKEFAVPGWVGEFRPEPLPSDFQFLGYDCIGGSLGSPASETQAPMMPHFDCSPLSCNSMAETIATNEWCLLSTKDEAERQAASFSTGVSHVEPGDYYVIEVWSRGEPVVNPPSRG